MPPGPRYVGLDVGGTSMKAGVVDDSGQFVAAPISVPTQAARGQEIGLQTMASAIRQAIASASLELPDVSAIGVATPGSMDIAAGVILDPPNLTPWKNVPVRRFIAETFGRPTAFQNDANAAAYGEYWAGAGRSAKSMVLFTLGTGIGGGIILNNRVLEGEHSHGAELGHMKIEVTNARVCGCGHRGCLEAYASATAVVKRTQELLDATSDSSTMRNREFTAHDIFEAADEGDVFARRIVDETAYYLAVGAANMIHVIDPEVIAFAGGMTAAGEGFLEKIRSHIPQLAFAMPAGRVQIRYAALGSEAGCIGAAGCGRLLVLGQTAS